MRLAFVPASRRHELTSLRTAVLTKEMHQYQHATPETSLIIIGLYDATRIVGYVAVNRPEDGHKTPHIEPSWADACEIRGLMIARGYRGMGYGQLLMHAALRYAQVSGYTLMIASAREVLVPWYQRFGFVPTPEAAYTIGEQLYIPGCLRVQEIEPILGSTPVTWDLPYPMVTPDRCVHGNGSTEITGRDVIRADVLDAPFLPSPDVIRAARKVALDPGYLSTTPQEPGALVEAIAEARGIPVRSILVAPGSSALMYAIFPQWFSTGSRVMLITPTYAEYPHLLKRLGCLVDEVPETMDLVHEIETRGSLYDGIVMVNPNSPSGQYVPHLHRALDAVDITTRVWIDETYIDYMGAGSSLERYAGHSPHVVVCKSMSKCYALSGARVAYVVGSPVQLEGILHPPWWVSRIAHTLALAALTPHSRAYYADRMEQTRVIVDHMVTTLCAMGLEPIGRPVASFVTCRLRRGDAGELVDRLKARGIYIREARGYPNSVRLAAQSWSKTRALLHAIRDYTEDT